MKHELLTLLYSLSSGSCLRFVLLFLVSVFSMCKLCLSMFFLIMDLSFSIEEWECLFSVLPWFSHLLTIYGFWSRLDIFWFYLLEEFEVPSENYQCIFSMCKLCLSMSFFLLFFSFKDHDICRWTFRTSLEIWTKMRRGYTY